MCNKLRMENQRSQFVICGKKKNPGTYRLKSSDTIRFSVCTTPALFTDKPNAAVKGSAYEQTDRK